MGREHWTTTIEVTFPAGISQLPEAQLHQFLTLLEKHDAALSMPRRYQPPALAVTLSIDTADLDQETPARATEFGETIVREQLESLGLGADWRVTASEACPAYGDDVVPVER